jgi:hypothetical protein
MRMTETNKDNITALTNKQFAYTTANSGNLRMYVLKGIERIGDGFAVCKVVDVSHPPCSACGAESESSNKQIFRTLYFSRIKK